MAATFDNWTSPQPLVNSMWRFRLLSVDGWWSSNGETVTWTIIWHRLSCPIHGGWYGIRSLLVFISDIMSARWYIQEVVGLYDSILSYYPDGNLPDQSYPSCIDITSAIYLGSQGRLIFHLSNMSGVGSVAGGWGTLEWNILRRVYCKFRLVTTPLNLFFFN